MHHTLGLMRLAILLGTLVLPWRAAAAPVRADRPPCDGVVTARLYLSDLAGHRFGAMWGLLTPTAQRAWQGVEEFARFQSAKFGGLRSIAIGVVGRDASGAVHLRLHFEWQNHGGIDGDGGALLATTPLRAGPAAGGRCAVLEPGPTGPGTPLVVPPHPAVAVARVPILMYHNVSSRPPRTSLQFGLTVADDDFAHQLAYLQSRGYQSITLVQLFEHLYYGRSLPRRPVVLTFDDGYDNAYRDAFPLLRRFRAVGVFNIITGKVGMQHDGWNSYASWDQLRVMLRAGMEIESHTVYHEDLRSVSLGVAWNELRYARAMLRARLAVPAQFLTYPAGEPFRSGSAAAQARILALTRRAGYVGALLDQRAPSTIQQAALPYQLPRIRVAGGEPLATFIASLNG